MNQPVRRQALTFDFGPNGIGGNRNSTAGDGYYALEFDLDNNGSFETVNNFYRLLGDSNGDRVVNALDSGAITAAFGRMGNNLDEDVNGDGVVNIIDRILAVRSQGKSIDAGLPLDD